MEKRWSKTGKEEPELSTGRDTAISYTKEHLYFPSADFNRQGERASKRQISIKDFKIKSVILKKRKVDYGIAAKTTFLKFSVARFCIDINTHVQIHLLY